MQSSNSAKTYSAGYAIMLTFSNDVKHNANAEHLADAWEEYGFQVIKANEVEMGMNSRQTREQQSERAYQWFADTLDTIDPLDDQLEDQLIVLCYIGHGATGGQKQHLFAAK